MATVNPSLFGMLGDETAMQRQLDEQRALSFANQTQEQRLASMGYKAGAQLGRGLAGAFGVDITDPAIRRATQIRALASQFDTTSPEGMMQFAQALQQVDLNASAQASQKALEMGKEQSIIAKNMRERQAADPLQKLLESGKYTPESIASYKASGNLADLKLAEKAGTSEFERLVDSLNIPDSKKEEFKSRRLEALTSGDTNGMKALTAQIAQARLEGLQAQNEQNATKAADDKRNAIAKLSDVETGIESSLATAEQALKLAPGTFLEASQQALLSQIPWSDQKAMANLVSSLNSDKAMSTLESLKTQSRTGATGFGALNTRELQLILDKTRALDPTDKMFKENLTYVMNGWKKIKDRATVSRLELQGKGDKLTELRNKIAAAKKKGSMSADEKASIDALKDELGVK